MGLSKNSYEKKSELDAYPYEHLLAVGVPDIKFYHTTRGLEALCPFHNDKSLGSFSFSPTTGVWKCFSCGESRIRTPSNRLFKKKRKQGWILTFP